MEDWEPYEARVSRTVLKGAGGEIPPAYRLWREKICINAYAIRYKHGSKNRNYAIALPQGVNSEAITGICESVKGYKSASSFNPTNSGMPIDCFEYLPLVDKIEDDWNSIEKIIRNEQKSFKCVDIEDVRSANIYVYEGTISQLNFYFISEERVNLNSIFRRKRAFFSEEGEAVNASEKISKLFFLSTSIGCAIVKKDGLQSSVLIFNKQSFFRIFNYDEHLKSIAQEKSDEMDYWNFINNIEFIRNSIDYKYVYRGLAKIFCDSNYMNQIRNMDAKVLKERMLAKSNGAFQVEDFVGDRVLITKSNFKRVMAMLAKDFKYNFFADTGEKESSD